MSTFLELCKDLRREGAGVGTGPTAVAGQVGEYGRIVEWILSAYEFVQNKNQGLWNFLRFDFSVPTVASTANYTLATLSLTELGTWKVDTFRCYLTATGINDQQDLEYVPWEVFRESYTLGSLSTQEGRPMVFTIKPNKSVTFWPIPDAVYTVTGEYFKRAQTMTLDADEPLIPAQFQQILVWKGLESMGWEQGAPEKQMRGEREFMRLLSELELDQLPDMMVAGPML